MGLSTEPRFGLRSWIRVQSTDLLPAFGRFGGSWSERIDQVSELGQKASERTTRVNLLVPMPAGVSNGGYQVRKAIEAHPETLDGGLRVGSGFVAMRRPDGVGLKQFPH